MAEVYIDVIGRDEGNTRGMFAEWGDIITGVENAIKLMSRAWDAAVGAIAPFINSAAESELTVAKLEAVLRATGGAAGVYSEDLQELAGDLQSVTRFSDEQILTGTSLLLTFRNISGEVLERAIPAMLDMGEIFGSTDAAAMQLGKALNDPVNMMGALSRAGVTFSDAQKETIKQLVESNQLFAAQDIILTELEMQVGGTAIAVGQTFTGQLEIAKNKIDEVRETIGRAFLPTLTDLLNRFSEFANRPEVIIFFDNLADSISSFLTDADLGGRLTGFLDTIMTAMETGDWTPVWDSIKDAISGGWDFIAPVIDDLFARLFNWMEEKVQDWIDGNGPSRLTNGITDNLNRTFQTPEFESRAGTAMQALLETLIGALRLVDWGRIGQAIGSSIDTSFANWSVRSGQSLDRWFANLSIDAANSIDRWFANLSIDIGRGIIDGLNNVEMNINQWVYDKIIAPVKRFLGISSPSTVFMQIGKDIVQGLIDGISSMFPTLTGIVSTLYGMLTGSGGGTGGATGDATGLLGGSTGTVGGRDMGSTTTANSMTGGTVTNIYNFYGTTYLSGVGAEGTYDCMPNPLISSGANPFPSGYR